MKTKSILTILTLIMAAGCLSAAAEIRLAAARPEEVGMDSRRLGRLDEVMARALEDHDFPGAVLLVTRQGKVVWRKAYGLSQLVPEPAPMKPDLIFDLASLTKPIATATSIMILVEQGRIRLWDRVKNFIPEFGPYLEEKGIPGEEVRLFHLLTHTSGLPPYTEPKEVAAKYGKPCPTELLVRHIAGLRKESRPGEKFVYSCLNYITLAQVVKIVAGQDLAEFSRQNIFKPLGMDSTFFNPPEEVRGRCVPTEVIEGRPLRGVVHDPLARLQGGISGNAGLFSTADDLAIFAQMMLNRGEFRGVRILSPLAVERMTEVFPRLKTAGRGFGWDLDSDYATVRGDLFGWSSYGHSGYTGTSIWIDPETATAIIFLTNRVHPDDRGEIISLRSRVANVVAAAIVKK
ncbi:MAG: serine hydrolase domain-containing protein [Candidatus Saccharicenans sp.]|nr:serine hydrolase domain-containing protein [Candidatus Saccharicenans sp.]MDI6848499.1 serine hydrolase domain-containing protein [Candidatus Saccharicenans sp.]